MTTLLEKLKKFNHRIPWRIDGTVEEYKWRRPNEPLPDIPERKAEDIFWINHFDGQNYTAYHVLIDSPNGGPHVVESFQYSDKEWMYNQTMALQQAIYFYNRYNEDVKDWINKNIVRE